MTECDLAYGADRRPSNAPGNSLCRDPCADQNFFDYLEAGDPLHEFLDDYPTVSRERAAAIPRRAGTVLTSSPDRSVT